jgi:hypothetical protein
MVREEEEVRLVDLHPLDRREQSPEWVFAADQLLAIEDHQEGGEGTGPDTPEHQPYRLDDRPKRSSLSSSTRNPGGILPGE